MWPKARSTTAQRNAGPLHVTDGSPLGIRSGGYGDPLLREPERVLEDVRIQFITFEWARDVYAVMFANTELTDALAVDVDGTARQQEVLRAGR